MQRTLSGLDFAPILPLWLIISLALLAVLALGIAFWRRARGSWWRLLAFALLLVALLNPRLVEETRDMRPDIALLMVDRSESARIGERASIIDKAREAIQARLARFPDLQLQTVEVPEGGSQGTRLHAAMERALADIPHARLAGVMALSDGQAHDVPPNPGLDAPFHLLMPGRPGEVDRRLRVIEAPGFGIVGKSVTLRVSIDDLGVPPPTGPVPTARLTIRRDGGNEQVDSVPIGQEHSITIPIERGGQTVVELQAETRPGEVSDINNRAVIAINGVRDRLRVLLVSGEPHAGERTWRRLLKADPNVDLVHFTILRPPEKDDLTPLNELALIAFPVRELFQVKIKDFDLIVFDRFANRGILPPTYLRNVADHVRAGGALLVSVGPEFSGPTSLASTPLGQILPVRPLPGQNAVAEGAFRPRVTQAGSRHPVTEGLPGANPADNPTAQATWGRWYRMLDGEARSGTTVMEGPGGAPLMQLDRVGEGRVALLLSDQIWLWSRGHDGGGPQQELLRRVAHWLMKEPELEEEDLVARIEGGQLTVTRHSLSSDTPPEVTITAPDGTETRRTLTPEPGGKAVTQLPAPLAGVWRVSDGTRNAFAAAAAPNPPEIADLRADPARLAPLIQASGGGTQWLGGANGEAPVLPDIRRVSAGRDMAGNSWIGLRRNLDHTVTGISAMPLLPPWAALPLLLGVAIFAWRREGR